MKALTLTEIGSQERGYMRILVAHGNTAEKIRYTQIFAKYGSVDFFDNGQDAVVSFINGFQTGNFYNLLVIENDLKQLDGVETVLMIRKYELEHLAANKKVIIVFNSDDQRCKSSYEARQGVDERIMFQSNSISLSSLECIAKNIAGVRSMNTLPGLARYRRSVSTFA